MATKLLFRNTDAVIAHRGRNDANLVGTATGWRARDLSTTQGSAATTALATSVTGPTVGIETDTAGSGFNEWLSPPLAAGVTISGTITYNLRMAEAMIAANAGAQCVVERVDNVGAIISTVSNKEFGTEMGTAEAAQNFTDAAPTSTAFNKGDRIRIRIAFNDAGGTMATGHQLTFWFNGAAGATGDSFVSFTETITFQTTNPSGTQLFPTTTNSDIADQGAGVDEEEMWTSRGAGVTSAIRNTATGFTTPLQWTTSAGGNTIEWYTKPLNAFTLSGLVKCNLRFQESASGANAGGNAELAVVNGDGSGAVVFGSGGIAGGNAAIPGDGELDQAAEAAESIFIAGQDISVSGGNRLRLRVRLDDSSLALVTGNTATLFYAGTSAAASGDSWIQIEQTLTEFVASVDMPGHHPLLMTLSRR